MVGLRNSHRRNVGQRKRSACAFQTESHSSRFSANSGYCVATAGGVAGAEALAVGPDDDHLHRVVAVGERERVVEGVDHLRGLAVGPTRVVRARCGRPRRRPRRRAGRAPDVPWAQSPAGQRSPARGHVGYASRSHFAGCASSRPHPRDEKETPLRGREDPPDAGREEEAADVPRRGGRRPFAPRRPVHRDHRAVRAAPGPVVRARSTPTPRWRGCARAPSPPSRCRSSSPRRACGRSTRPSAASRPTPSSRAAATPPARLKPAEKKAPEAGAAPPAPDAPAAEVRSRPPTRHRPTRHLPTRRPPTTPPRPTRRPSRRRVTARTGRPRAATTLEHA